MFVTCYFLAQTSLSVKLESFKKTRPHVAEHTVVMVKVHDQYHYNIFCPKTSYLFIMEANTMDPDQEQSDLDP